MWRNGSFTQNALSITSQSHDLPCCWFASLKRKGWQIYQLYANMMCKKPLTVLRPWLCSLIFWKSKTFFGLQSKNGCQKFPSKNFLEVSVQTFLVFFRSSPWPRNQRTFPAGQGNGHDACLQIRGSIDFRRIEARTATGIFNGGNGRRKRLKVKS